MTVPHDHPLDVATAPKRDSKTWEQSTISWGDVLGWLATPATVKECGNYVLGRLKGNRRTKTSILHRGALTLDVDSPEPGFAESLELLLPYTCAVHTTFKSTAQAPRYRLIIPLDRNVAPDEYHTAAAAVMQKLGEGQFDPGSVQAERYMFKPAAADLDAYEHFLVPGPLAKAEDLLAEFEPDLSTIPAPKPHKNKRNPFEIDGTVGAFNRAYEDMQLLIDTYELPYEPDGTERWHLVGAAAAAGMGTVQAGLVFSHHANDPAYGQTCSAFDLVRLHRFHQLDEQCNPRTPVNRRPSHQAMLELATQDARVVEDLVGADFKAELDDLADAVDDDNWRTRFVLNPRTGKPEDVVHNWDLIGHYDPAMRGLYFNELSMAIETDRDLPWRKLEEGRETFDSGDRSSLALHIEREYGVRPARGYLDDLINDTARNRRVNPVRDYLATLVWDGVPRVETCLPGVTPTPYTRLVARKAMTAAVARMMEPGIKWDHMLVLYGSEGLGKSFWVDRMARGYSSSLGRIGDKDTLITMQRSWIMTSDEGHSMKKADFDTQKEFLTRTADIFRMPYEREAQVQKRHCVIWGTTNDEVFLRRQEGNRRFLIVRCEAKVDFSQLTPQYVDQVWAEALHLYRQGEQLFLTDEESQLAAHEREDFTEEDALTGLVQGYLDTLVPPEWDEMSPDARQLWMQNRNDGFTPPGTEQITRVCTVQIWVEALGRRYGDHKRVDLLEIHNALKQVPGWRALPGRQRLPGYGPQQVFERQNETHEAIDELI